MMEEHKKKSFTPELNVTMLTQGLDTIVQSISTENAEAIVCPICYGVKI